MSGITDIWHEDNRSTGENACMIPVSEVDGDGKRKWKGMPSSILYGKSIGRIGLPLGTFFEMRQSYSANSELSYPTLDPSLIFKDGEGEYVKDFVQDGSLPDGAVISINGCPSDVDPVDIENGDGCFQYFCIAEDPYLYDLHPYEDFDALNKLKEIGFVVLDSRYLASLVHSNLPFTPYRPSIAELVYDATANITELIVEDISKNKWRRRYSHANNTYVAAWAKDTPSVSGSVASELASTDPIYTPLLNSGSDIYGYMNGQEGLLGLNPFGVGSNFSISVGGKVMSIQKSDGSYASISSYSSVSPFVKRVLISKDITTLSAYKYSLYGIDFSRFKKLSSLTLNYCRGFSGQKLPASLVSVHIQGDSANDQVISEVNLPLCTGLTLRDGTLGDSLTINTPICTTISLRTNPKLKYLTVQTDMPSLTSAIIDFGNLIELDGLVFLTKMPNIQSLQATNMNLIDKAGQHLILPALNSLKLLVLRNCSLSQASVDSLISFMLDHAQSGRIPAAQITLAIGRDDVNSPYTGRINASPSATGLANVDTLRGLGAYVEHN